MGVAIILMVILLKIDSDLMVNKTFQNHMDVCLGFRNVNIISFQYHNDRSLELPKKPGSSIHIYFLSSQQNSTKICF